MPALHCFTATKHPWVVLTEGVPAFAGNYDEAQVSSAEARARVATVMDQG